MASLCDEAKKRVCEVTPLVSLYIHPTTTTAASCAHYGILLQVSWQLCLLILNKIKTHTHDETCGDLKWQDLTAKSLFSRSRVIHWKREGAAEKIHQLLIPAGQDGPLPSVAQPRGHPAGVFIRSALYGGRAQCEWAYVCVKRQLLLSST